MKKIFTITILALSINAFAQVPTNGLIGFWPFNGNALDQSGNGHDGTVSGAILTADRFGNSASAYSLDGVSNFIQFANPSTINLGTSDFTISIWIYLPTNSGASDHVFGKSGADSWVSGNKEIYLNNNQPGFNSCAQGMVYLSTQLTLMAWHNLVYVYNASLVQINIYLDNVVYDLPLNFYPAPLNPDNNTDVLYAGRTGEGDFFNGKIDDIRIYNRILTQQEITAIFYEECDLSIQITPTDYRLASNDNAQFDASSSESTASYHWQTNPSNIGWQDVPSNSTYSGNTTTTLKVNNVQLSNHLQSFRVIASTESCQDTSDIARICISDTCLLTVTDTLVINANLTDLQAPFNTNTIKVYPNPANDHITIDYGNYENMSGYKLKITNTLGAAVFTTTINQPASFIDLNGWSGNGVYFVHLIDPQNNTVDVRIIVIQ
jgi:hypothetical protein